MKWLRIGSGFSVRLCLLALLLLVASAWAVAQDQPTSLPLSPDTIHSAPLTTNTLGTLSGLLDQLSQKVSDLQAQVTTLNQQSDQLQSWLTASETALELSKKLRQEEAQAASQAIQAARNSGLWWKRACLVLAGAGVGYAVDKWTGAAIGAGSGAVVDAGMEIAFAIKVKL
jgi:TolA-binding protein